MIPSPTPLYVDKTLPLGWYRQVSQRQTGSSAGRYDVFIFSPFGLKKRFSSRNALKQYFEKTNETILNADDFDFSVYGKNNPTPYPRCSVEQESASFQNEDVSQDPNISIDTPNIVGQNNTTIQPNFIEKQF